MIKPECRICGASVKHFGDYCAECEADAQDDGLMAIVRADLIALQEKGDQ